MEKVKYTERFKGGLMHLDKIEALLLLKPKDRDIIVKAWMEYILYGVEPKDDDLKKTINKSNWVQLKADTDAQVKRFRVKENVDDSNVVEEVEKKLLPSCNVDEFINNVIKK